MKYDKELMLILFSNLILILGVIFWKWNFYVVFSIYIIDIIIIGVLNNKKIKIAQKEDSIESLKEIGVVDSDKNKIISSLIFWNNGYIIMAMPFVIVIFIIYLKNNFSLYPIFITSFVSIVSHFVSYKINYINKKEYTNTSSGELVKQMGFRVLIIILILCVFTTFSGVLKLSLFYTSILLAISKVIFDVTFYLNLSTRQKI